MILSDIKQDPYINEKIFEMVQNTPTIYIDDEEICRDGRLTFIDYNV